MLRNDARHDSLDPRYHGPYELLDRKGPEVKLSIRKETENSKGKQHMTYRNKWVHLDRCKEFLSASQPSRPTSVKLAASSSSEI